MGVDYAQGYGVCMPKPLFESGGEMAVVAPTPPNQKSAEKGTKLVVARIESGKKCFRENPTPIHIEHGYLKK